MKTPLLPVAHTILDGALPWITMLVSSCCERYVLLKHEIWSKLTFLGSGVCSDNVIDILVRAKESFRDAC